MESHTTEMFEPHLDSIRYPITATLQAMMKLQDVLRKPMVNRTRVISTPTSACWPKIIYPILRWVKPWMLSFVINSFDCEMETRCITKMTPNWKGLNRTSRRQDSPTSYCETLRSNPSNAMYSLQKPIWIIWIVIYPKKLPHQWLKTKMNPISEPSFLG